MLERCSKGLRRAPLPDAHDRASCDRNHLGEVCVWDQRLGLSASLVAPKNLLGSPSFHCHKRIIGLHRTRADEEARVDRRKWECDHGPYRGWDDT